jgi:3-hydroxyisobutyrate dehydrogenase-like beta-hydroxyacid dehydrogenase
MVGGAEDDVESDRAQAVLDALGEDVYHLGGVGAGHTTKLLNNQIGAAVRAVSLEASAVAAAREIDLRTFMRVIRNSSGSSYQFRKRLPRVANRDFEGGFATEMSRKDVRLALEMADSVDARAYVTSIVHELYKEADAAGFGDEDSAAMVKLFEERTGVPFETDEPVDENFLDWYDM